MGRTKYKVDKIRQKIRETFSAFALRLIRLLNPGATWCLSLKNSAKPYVCNYVDDFTSEHRNVDLGKKWPISDLLRSEYIIDVQRYQMGPRRGERRFSDFRGKTNRSEGASKRREIFRTKRNPF